MITIYFTDKEYSLDPPVADGLRRYDPSGALSINIHSAECLVRNG